MIHLESLEDHTRQLWDRIHHTSQRPYILIWGTALALQLNHRKSVDLDFIVDRKILSADTALIKSLSNNYQITLDTSEQVDYYIDGVQFTLLSYRWAPLYPIIDDYVIHMWDYRDIASSKAYTIGRRQEIKDYIDLYRVLNYTTYSLQDIIRDAQIRYGGDFSAKLFIQQLLLCDQCEWYQVYFIGESITHAELIQYFESLISDYLEQSAIQ